MDDFIASISEGSIFITDDIHRKIQEMEQSDIPPELKRELKQIYILIDRLGQAIK